MDKTQNVIFFRKILFSRHSLHCFMWMGFFFLSSFILLNWINFSNIFFFVFLTHFVCAKIHPPIGCRIYMEFLLLIRIYLKKKWVFSKTIEIHHTHTVHFCFNSKKKIFQRSNRHMSIHCRLLGILFINYLFHYDNLIWISLYEF